MSNTAKNFRDAMNTLAAMQNDTVTGLENFRQLLLEQNKVVKEAFVILWAACCQLSEQQQAAKQAEDDGEELEQ